MALRYALTKQLHFLGEADGRPVLVTVQRWDAQRSATRRCLHVVLNDGAVQLRRLCVSAADLAHLDGALDETLTRYGHRLLTEQQARTRIADHTGHPPAEDYCAGVRCGAPIPLGADRCEHGHPIGQIGAGGMSGVRRAPLILRTGAPAHG